jgi:hypothetical protein
MSQISANANYLQRQESQLESQLESQYELQYQSLYSKILNFTEIENNSTKGIATLLSQKNTSGQLKMTLNRLMGHKLIE